MSTYYKYRDVKVMIAHKLMNIDGWKVYDYHADRSDIMTDYYCPANWGGVAEKNGYILCVDVYGASEPQEIKRYTSANAIDRTIYEKISKLEEMTTERGATKAEETTAQQRIKVLKDKLDKQQEESRKYIVVGTIPAHMANPPRCNWHIEKDGAIIAKGNGILKYAKVDEYYSYPQYEESLKKYKEDKKAYTEQHIQDLLLNGYYSDREKAEQITKRHIEELEQDIKLINQFEAFINKIDTTCGGLIGEDDGTIYKKVTVTEYKNENKAVEDSAGSVKDGQCFILKSNFNYGCYKGLVYRIHSTEYNGKTTYHAYKLNGKLTKECTGRASSNNYWFIGAADDEKFLKWIEKGSIAWCHIEEVKTPYEVEKVVKKTIKAEKKTAKKQTKTETAKEQPKETTKEPEQKEKPLVKYYTINEKTARTAKELNSFRDYKSGEATETYKYYVDEAAELAKSQIEKYPEEEEKILYYLDKYAAKLANWYNDYYRNEASCPSVMICGGANFPTRKKEKQNSRRDTLHSERKYIDGILDKIKGIGTAGIKAGDKNAIEKLERKISEMEADHKRKMAINNYYKKNKTLEGCELMTAEEIKETTDFMARFPFYQPCQTINDTANIRRYKKRLESLKKAKSTENTEEENEHCKIVRNTEIMRIQLLFDGKPSEEVRNILKSNGFRWAPSQSAWQRNLNNNGEYALKRVIEQLNGISA